MCQPKISFYGEFEPRNYFNFQINIRLLLGGRQNYKESEVMSKRFQKAEQGMQTRGLSGWLYGQRASCASLNMRVRIPVPCKKLSMVFLVPVAPVWRGRETAAFCGFPGLHNEVQSCLNKIEYSNIKQGSIVNRKNRTALVWRGEENQKQHGVPTRETDTFEARFYCISICLGFSPRKRCFHDCIFKTLTPHSFEENGYFLAPCTLKRSTKLYALLSHLT